MYFVICFSQNYCLVVIDNLILFAYLWIYLTKNITNIKDKVISFNFNIVFKVEI